MGIKSTDNEDNMRIARNVRLIRDHWGDNRKQLVELLEWIYPYDTIKSYEDGSRPVPDDYIKAIAKLYGVTENMIKEQTLTEDLLTAYDSKLDISKFANDYDFLLCTATTSEAARENEDFLKADDLLQSIINFDYQITTPTEARNLYFKCFEETGIFAGAANTLMMLFVEYCHLTIAPSTDDLVKALTGHVTTGQFYAKFRNIWSDLTPERKDFLNKTQGIFDKCVAALSKTFEGRIYAEYYMALKYLICMIDNGRDYRENLEIGIVMMRELAKIENRLACKAISVFNVDD